MIEKAKKLLKAMYGEMPLELFDFTHTGTCIRLVFLGMAVNKFYVVRYNYRELRYDVDVFEASQETKSYSEWEVRDLLDGDDSEKTD